MGAWDMEVTTPHCAGVGAKMKVEESCFKCKHGLHDFEGIRCEIHGYYFKDYVARKTSCGSQKELVKEE